MSEPQRSIEAAVSHVAARWDEPRTERTLAGARGKRAARRVRMWTASAALGCAALAAAAFVVWYAPAANRPAAESAAVPQRAIGFADGSRALLLDSAAEIVTAAATDSLIDLSLRSGRARFDVTPRAERAFRVACGDVVVQVLGTSFELARDGARTHVQVMRGRVAVRWPSGATELTAGASGWFPPADAAASAGPAAPAAGATDPDGDDAEGRRPRAESWRQHAEQGDFGRAYALLARARTHVADDVEELLLAADAARLSGHAAQAVPYLQKVIDVHAGDPRAPLAAFTLGGVLMNQLGRPREAEAAYARARALSPGSSLSQDALARQVEAAHRAGDTARARTLALDYLERYPDGRRVHAVRRFGGLP